MTDATNFVPIDPVGRGWMRHRLTILKVADDGITYQPEVTNLRCYIDRPTGGLRFGQTILAPDYTHRVLLAAEYRKPDGSTFTLDSSIVKEGSRVEAVFDGRTFQLVVRRRYNPSSLNRYLILECVLTEPRGDIQPLNP